jgi:hypothetical protein
VSATEEEGKLGDLKIDLVYENWFWYWKVSRWNHRQHKWDREKWKEVTGGISLDEAGAKESANKAVKRIRRDETRKEYVYFNRCGNGVPFDAATRPRVARLIIPVRWLVRRIGL